MGAISEHASGSASCRDYFRRVKCKTGKSTTPALSGWQVIWARASAWRRCRAEWMVRARAAAEKTQERTKTRAQREAMKSLRELLAEAQIAFNAYTRARDAGLPCIDCGKPFEP